MNKIIAEIKIKDLGTMEFELFLDTPISTGNFIHLAEKKFYDGLSMHRIIPDFVAQGGCPLGTGTGGPGHNIDGEFKNNGFDNPHSHNKGAIAWARSMARNSAGSQFYITLADTLFLDEDYAVFGQLISGEEVLEKLNELGTQQGTPIKNVIIESVLINDNGVEIPPLVTVN